MGSTRQTSGQPVPGDDGRVAGAAGKRTSDLGRFWWAAAAAVLVVGLLATVPVATAEATQATAAQQDGTTEFNATSGSGELRIGGDDGQTIDIEPGDIVIEGEASDGTWESTDVDFSGVGGSIGAEITAPNGLEGEYDPENDRFTLEGELLVSVGLTGDQFRFRLVAESERSETDLTEDGGRAVVADDTFTVNETGTEVIDERLGLPATEPGENSIRAPFNIETPGSNESEEETEPAELSVTPESVEFESITEGETATRTVTIANEGGEPLRLRRAELRQWPGELRVGAELPIELAPGEQRELTVTFAPERPGVRTTTLLLVGENPSVRETVPVASGRVEAEVTVEENRTRVDASVQDARANESINIAVPDDTDTDEDDEFETEEFGITPAENTDVTVDIETSNQSLEDTPETDAGFTPNAAQLGNISVETNLSPDETERVEITTRINRSRLEELDTDPGNVTMYRFNESQDRWRPQRTEVIDRTEETIQVRAIADHASEWTAAAARPEFEITDSNVNVDVATVEETVTINVFVENTGGTEGTYVADLLLNGEVVDSKESVIAKGGEALFDFERSFDQPGTYEVQVNDQRITEIEVTEAGGTETDPGDGSATDGDSGTDGEGGTDGGSAETEDTETNGTDGGDGTASSDGLGPGFGVLAGVTAVLVTALAARRRS
ncbi:hypothetical protein GRX03_09150 [Halovenus sp. WSH3]|uniref:Abnormal spindle-like microcephaly-associated protein ASH domain-containing protein n=1 Tax=Halovenus carboxidivorans TaxID=2692199 RepID=A0A6B0TF07_9EURY|nr:hypothetical protein [Halovenus carboxidivorans]MXR51769.1 hypothetical protein [Halovenus carboxidivorans]